MKLNFIHTADIHLGIKFDVKDFSLKEREKRREELWDTFDNIISIVKSDKIPYLFISGDMTEGEYLSFKNLKRIINCFKAVPETKVIISCGSSDPYNINNMYEYIRWPENVYIVKNVDSVDKIDFEGDNLCIYSVSCSGSGKNINPQIIYDLSVDINRINVLILNHEDDSMLPLNMDLVKNKFDYCAMGGKHNFLKVCDNIVYAGTPEPLSFDETGEHGIVRGILKKGNTEFKFIPIAKRKFEIRNIELIGSQGFNKILDLIKFSGNTFSNIKDYIRIDLIGTVSTDISVEEIKKEAEQFFYYIEFQDNYSYEKDEDRKYDSNDYNIIESYKYQFQNQEDKLEQQAFKLGLEVLRKEKVVK